MARVWGFARTWCAHLCLQNSIWRRFVGIHEISSEARRHIMRSSHCQFFHAQNVPWNIKMTLGEFASNKVMFSVTQRLSIVGGHKRTRFLKGHLLYHVTIPKKGNSATGMESTLHRGTCWSTALPWRSAPDVSRNTKIHGWNPTMEVRFRWFDWNDGLSFANGWFLLSSR